MINKLQEDVGQAKKAPCSATSGIKGMVSSKVLKILIGTSIIGALATSLYNKGNKAELQKEELPAIEKAKNDFKYDESKISFWDDSEEFFRKGYKYSAETHTVKIGGKNIRIKIIHDAGLDFYKVTSDDIQSLKVRTGKFKLVADKDAKGKIKKDKRGRKLMKKEEIITSTKKLDFDMVISKLTQIDRFKYLSRKEYDRNNPNNKTHSFNISKSHALRKGIIIPIPLDSKVRQLSDAKFAYYCQKAIDDMKTDVKYSAKTREFINLIGGERRLVAAMIAYARSETTEDYVHFSQKIGYTELHRWEDLYKTFSFTHYHILMDGPGLKARNKLGLTEGQCYHPQNAGKLFIGYWIEKSRGDLNRFFPINTPERIRKAGAVFNGSSSYVPKFKANFEYSNKLLGV